MKNFITNNKNTILLLIIAALAIYNIFNINGIKTDVKGYKQQIETIQTKVDSAQIVNKVIDGKIQKVDEKVVTVTKEIHHIDNTIIQVKHNTDEKIDSADNYGVNELELFFANRYK
jgi:peptidoglycan hydrolase CwlO-like protein